MRKGELPAQLVDDRYRFNRIELPEWAAQHKMPVSPEILEEPGLLPRQATPLAEAIRAGGIHRDLPASDKEGLLRAMVDRLPMGHGLDREFLFRMVLAREHLGSTALGNGIAIPHPRNPIVLRVGAPAVAVCYLAAPVDFHALDGKPVHTLFTVVSPSVRVHLHLLAVLATALHDPAFLAAVSRRAGAAELISQLDRIESGVAARSAAKEDPA